MTTVNFDMGELDGFIKRLRQAAGGDFKTALAEWSNAMGVEFLRIVSDEIRRLEVVDTRQLLNSFTIGGEGNVYNITDGGLTLEIGSSVKYAAFVNDGHMTVNPDTKGAFTLKDGTLARFVPGDVTKDGNGKITSFRYNRQAKGGMVLKAKWVEGRHYFESAINIFEKMFPTLMEKMLQQWINAYFAGVLV